MTAFTKNFRHLLLHLPSWELRFLSLKRRNDGETRRVQMRAGCDASFSPPVFAPVFQKLGKDLIPCLTELLNGGEVLREWAVKWPRAHTISGAAQWDLPWHLARHSTQGSKVYLHLILLIIRRASLWCMNYNSLLTSACTFKGDSCSMATLSPAVRRFLLKSLSSGRETSTPITAKRYRQASTTCGIGYELRTGR